MPRREMLGKKKKTKEEQVYEYRFRHFPNYCKYDGKKLLDKREILGTKFGTETGRPIEDVRYGRYCPDWQMNRQLHTEHWGSSEPEYIDKEQEMKKDKYFRRASYY